MNNLLIDIKSKTYPSAGRVKKVCAIENLRFSPVRGEFLCLLGPSGCGKTTLLHILAGLDKDFQGNIEWSNHKQPDPRIGYVFQQPRLLPWRTVRENIELVLPPNHSSESIQTLLTILGLDETQYTFPQRLSLGMCRRVAIARAFAIEPDLLLMDEPFVSLDAPTARRARNLLIDVWSQRPHTVIFVTHDLREAIMLADRLLFLSASPSTVISDIQVSIPRNERKDEERVEQFRNQLLHAHPETADLL